MLERLDEIAWGELQAAYGPADWVPEALRSLLDPDPEVRHGALSWIEGGTFHQQTADEATPHLVPFLIELVGDPATPDRLPLLDFLVQLVGSDSVDPVPDQEAADGRRADELRKHESWPDSPVSFYQANWRACQAAAWKEANILLGLLDDGDPRVRADAGLLLALLLKDGNAVAPAGAPPISERLRDAVGRERDPLVRAGQVLALGTAAARHPEARGWLRAIEAAAELDDPAGLAAAFRLIDLGEPLDEAAARRFVERALRFDAVAAGVQPSWSRSSCYDEPGSYIEVEGRLGLRFARLADRHPGLRTLVRERAVDGPPSERANALRLLARDRNPRGEEDGGGTILVQPEDDLVVRLAAAEVEAACNASEAAEAALPTAIEAMENSDPAIRRRAAGLLRRFDDREVAAWAEELADAVGGERDPAVMAALAGALSRPAPRVSGRRKRRRDDRDPGPFLDLLQTWLEAPDGPRDWSVRRELWDRLGAIAHDSRSESLAGWINDWIENPALIEAVDSDRSRAVACLRRLERPEWQLRHTLDRLLREDPDPRVRRASVWSPSWEPAPVDRLPSVDAILGALRDDGNEDVRAAAAEALAPFLMDTDNDPALAGAMVRALAAALDDDPSWRVRMEAARNLGLAAPTVGEARGVQFRQVTRHAALGQSSPGNEEAVRALVRASACDSCHDVRRAACDSLQNVAAAVPEMTALLRSASPAARAWAAEALASVGDAAAEALPALLDALATAPDPTVRSSIARTVWRLISRQDVTPWLGPLARALRDPEVTVREWIARGLKHSGATAAPLAGELAECLRSGPESLRLHTLEALASIGPGAGAALPAVIDLFGSPAIGEQLLAMKAAWAISGDRAPHLGALLEAIERLARDPAPNVRDGVMQQTGSIAAALAPGRPERDRAIAILRAGRSDPDRSVRGTANRALRNLEKARGDDPGPGERSPA